MDRKLIVQSFYSLAANGMPAVLGLLSFRLLSGELGTDSFGKYILAIAAYGIFNQLRAGIVSASFIKLASGLKDKSELLGASWLVSVAVFFLASVLGALLVAFEVISIEIYWPILVAALASTPSFIAMVLAQSNEKFQRVAIIRFLETGSFFGFIWYHLHGGLSEIDALWLFSYAALFTSITTTILSWSAVQHMFRATYQKVLDIWAFGKFTSGTQLITSLLTNTDVFLIEHFLGSGSVALYEYGRKWLEIFEVPFRSIAGVYYSRVSAMVNNNRLSEVWSFITKRVFRTAGLSILVVPIIYFMAPWLIELISSERHNESIWVFRILLILPVLIPFDRFYGLSLDAIGLPKLNFYKGIILLVTNFALDVLVLKMGGGILGVAIVSVAFYGVGSLLSVVWLKRNT